MKYLKAYVKFLFINDILQQWLRMDLHELGALHVQRVTYELEALEKRLLVYNAPWSIFLLLVLFNNLFEFINLIFAHRFVSHHLRDDVAPCLVNAFVFNGVFQLIFNVFIIGIDVV